MRNNQYTILSTYAFFQCVNQEYDFHRSIGEILGGAEKDHRSHYKYCFGRKIHIRVWFCLRDIHLQLFGLLDQIVQGVDTQTAFLQVDVFGTDMLRRLEELG